MDKIKRKRKVTNETQPVDCKKMKMTTKTEDSSEEEESEAICAPEFNPKWQDFELLAERKALPLDVSVNIVKLFDDGNEIPFIARYRKGETRDMSPEQLRDVKECYEDVKALRKKMGTILRALEKAKLLNASLLCKITYCRDMEELEHLYAPYKPGSKRTLAEQAKELGLEKPALNIMSGAVEDIHVYVDSAKKGLKNADEVEKGILHIIASVIATDSEVLEFLRKLKPEVHFTLETKKAVAKKSEKDAKVKNVDESKFSDYFDFKVPVKFIKPHQVLAINRGESQKVLSVKITIPDFMFHRYSNYCSKKFLHPGNPEGDRIISNAINDAYTRLLQPLIIRQIRTELKLAAEKASHEVFSTNLKQLLLSPPLKGKRILGIDPGFSHGCKTALISETGDVLAHSVIYPHSRSADSRTKAASVLRGMLQKHNCALIALGNGTGCRKTEEWLTELIRDGKWANLDVSYTIVAEEGVSIYSCSEEAKKEFGNLDPTVIGAARRLQDPLAELVKVEPQHLGVGMYQHDMRKKQLQDLLEEVVSECVSFVGVDLNTASQCLLRKIAGLSDKRATEIINHRQKSGPFVNRKQLMDVKGIGARVFEQCAGFLQVGPVNEKEAVSFYKQPGTTKLDRTYIHPESYGVAKKLLKAFGGLKADYIGSETFIEHMKKKAASVDVEQLSTQMEVPASTLNLIIETLCKPLSHDLRMVQTNTPLFRKGLTDINELTLGTILSGRINNVTHFGCFVDVGVGCNGLIHSSKMRGLSLQVGDRVEVQVLKVEIDRKRIGLEAVKKL